MINACKILVDKPKGRDHAKHLDADERITLKWMLGKQGGKVGSGCIWLRKGTSDGLL
jgi:hypothetical protein